MSHDVAGGSAVVSIDAKRLRDIADMIEAVD